ncbi:MAG: Ig-like domain-containing protein [Lachnospiraceae bacterium]|nr:Ig-like domain-containing protein [bacterium]MDY5516660.1 Ig-like domain-containing protein [Lachnospiraceae bacterium]
MENRKTSFMKRAAMFVIALAVVLTTVLIPVPAKAAAKDAFIVSSYTMAKGEKWTLNVYNAGNAKISYKSSKKSVATVSKKGVVTAKKAGSATITVTIKEGKDTYQGKTKIKVKSKITTADAIKRVNAELNLLYVNTYELAEGLGVLEDETVIEYLNACAEIVELGNDMAKKPSAYSEEEILEELDAIATMAQSMVELVDELAS